MNKIRNQVAIVGTGFSEIGRRVSGSAAASAIEACLKATEDAGITLEQIDGISNYPNPSRLGAGNVDGLDYVSLNYLVRTLPLRNLRWNCSITQGTVTASLVEAVHAVAVGACEYALVYRAMFNPPGRFGVGDVPIATGPDEFTAPWGLSNVVMAFALAYSGYLHRYKRSREEFAPFIVSNRRNASLNPESVFQDLPITEEDYLSAEMIAHPMNILDCDMPVTGCGAVIVTTAERAADLPVTPVFVTGGVSLGINYHDRVSMYFDDFRESAGHLAAQLWRNTGLSPTDIDQPNLYDGFSWFVPLWLEAFGFCQEGTAFDFIREGHTELQGSCPVNPSGGALGMGRLHGTPQLIEGVRQLQGVCGPRQVRGAKTSLVHSGGAVTGCAAVVLSSDCSF